MSTATRRFRRRARMEINAIVTKAMRWSFRALEDGVQPPVAAEPGEGPLNHPADAGYEPFVSAAGNCLDGDAERSHVLASMLLREGDRKSKIEIKVASTGSRRLQRGSQPGDSETGV